MATKNRYAIMLKNDDNDVSYFVRKNTNSIVSALSLDDKDVKRCAKPEDCQSLINTFRLFDDFKEVDVVKIGKTKKPISKRKLFFLRKDGRWEDVKTGRIKSHRWIYDNTIVGMYTKRKFIKNENFRTEKG